MIEESSSQAGWGKQIIFPANLISLLRMLLVPFWIWTFYAEHEASIPWMSLGLAALIGISDWLDGIVARARNEITSLGLILDPLADKACILGGGLALTLWWGFPWWVLGLLVLRDLVIVTVSFFIIRGRGKPIASRPLGKWTTTVLGLMAVLLLLRLSPYWEIMLGIAMALWLASCVDYAMLFLRSDLLKRSSRL